MQPTAIQQLVYLQHMGIYPWIHTDTIANAQSPHAAIPSVTSVTTGHAIQENLRHDAMQDVQSVEDVQPYYDYHFVQGHRDSPYWILLDAEEARQYQALLDQIVWAIALPSASTAIIQIQQLTVPQSRIEHAMVMPQQVIVFGMRETEHHWRHLAIDNHAPTIVTISLAELVRCPEKKAQVWQDLCVLKKVVQ
jgi:hypothetical protein